MEESKATSNIVSSDVLLHGKIVYDSNVVRQN